MLVWRTKCVRLLGCPTFNSMGLLKDPFARWSDAMPGQAACNSRCDFLTLFSRAGMRSCHEDTASLLLLYSKFEHFCLTQTWASTTETPALFTLNLLQNSAEFATKEMKGQHKLSDVLTQTQIERDSRGESITDVWLQVR